MFIEKLCNEKSIKRRKLIQGVGINDAPYITKLRISGKEIRCPYFVKWVTMLQRCYDVRVHEKRSKYLECFVCKEWLLFSNFKLWMEQQDWVNKVLDKDIFGNGTLYSPDSCYFISQHINSLLSLREKARGNYPLGVSYNSRDKKFTAQCSNGINKNKHIGYFFTAKEARNAYLVAKKNIILTLAYEESDTKLKNKLIEISNNLTAYE